MPAPAPSAGSTDRLRFERALRLRGIGLIAGVDEAGRGPLAGPVVAAAVILPSAWIDVGLPGALRGLNDSKRLSATQRDDFHAQLTGLAEVRFAVAAVEPEEIDRLNILRATHRAMKDALRQLVPGPEHVLVDGLPVPSLGWPQTAVVKGDALSYSIAAASVLAKVTRDRRMIAYERIHPGYGFAQHKGYPTPEHLHALRRLGPCPIHRRSFAPVRAVQLDLL
jgi:ribonuclease HII